MKQYNWNNSMELIQNTLGAIWVDEVKATSVKRGAFNDMEGYTYVITVKFFGKKISETRGYKNKFIQIVTNSTYMEDLEYDNDKTTDLQAFNNFIELFG